MNWVLYTIFAMLLWGLWGFLSKLSTTHIQPADAYVYQAIGILIGTILMAFFVKFQPGGKPAGILPAIFAGLAATLGTYLFFTALARSKGSMVVAITALYPIVTLLLSSIFLQESLSLRQILGIGLAISAIVLLSI